MEKEPEVTPSAARKIETLTAEAEALRKERDEARESWQLREHPSPTECPTYYDGCNCTVPALLHNIERAEKAESEAATARASVAELVAAVRGMRTLVDAEETDERSVHRAAAGSALLAEIDALLTKHGGAS